MILVHSVEPLYIYSPIFELNGITPLPSVRVWLYGIPCRNPRDLFHLCSISIMSNVIDAIKWGKK
jgi:hypothetical protein